MVDQKISASFETPKKIEKTGEAKIERPGLHLEQEKKVVDKKSETRTSVISISPNNSAVSVLPYYEERRKNIEIALSKGLEDIYLSMSPSEKAHFKKVGEETSEKINKLLEKTKINIGKIISLIRKWLTLVPGVNKLFLEQEAKIRTDEVVKLKKTQE